MEEDDSVYGIHELSTCENPKVDVVAVHGLNGHPYNTWTSPKTNICWLKERSLLPTSLKDARILTWGYNANVLALLGDTSSDRILQHAQTLVAQLEADRSIQDAEERPIMFICHSLGGIIVKRALAYSASRTSANITHLHSIFVSTYGILFLGTPHNGSDRAHLAGIGQRMIKTLAPRKLVDTDSQLLAALEKGSETLQNVTDQFAPLMKQFHIFFFWEQHKTDLGYTKHYVPLPFSLCLSLRSMEWDLAVKLTTSQVVDESSAAPILDNTERSGIPASHSEMCKFDSRSSPGYQVVVAALKRYSRDAPASIRYRWEEAHAMLRKQRENEAMELVRGR